MDYSLTFGRLYFPHLGSFSKVFHPLSLSPSPSSFSESCNLETILHRKMLNPYTPHAWIFFYCCSPSLDLTERHSWLALTVGGFFTFLSLYAINQTQIQRYLTMQDLNTATKSLWLSLPLLMFLSFATCFCGLSIFAMYHNCDPIRHVFSMFLFLSLRIEFYWSPFKIIHLF